MLDECMPIVHGWGGKVSKEHQTQTPGPDNMTTTQQPKATGTIREAMLQSLERSSNSLSEFHPLHSSIFGQCVTNYRFFHTTRGCSTSATRGSYPSA